MCPPPSRYAWRTLGARREDRRPVPSHGDRAVDQHITAMCEPQGMERILLDDEDRHALRGSSLGQRIEKICFTISGASPSDGSSSMSNLGRDMSARAMASICCSPPESVPPRCVRRSLRRGNRCRYASRDRLRSSRHRRCRGPRPSGGFPAPSCAGRCAALPAIGQCCRRAISCGLVARRCPASFEKDAPLSALPAFPNTDIMSVDLPAPLAPMSVTISPALHGRAIPELSALDVTVVTSETCRRC